MHTKKFKIARFIFLILYIICAAVLIIESCQNGTSSSEHSSNVGGLFADLINGIKGDQATPIAPEAVHITNKDNADKLNVQTRDRIKLSLKTTPENASFQSYIYTSEAKDIASVDNNGNVSFLKRGKAIIKATNKDYPSVFDTIEFNITDVELTKINTAVVASELDKPDPIEDDNHIYTLYKDMSYSIKYEFLPANVTSAHVTFRSANPSVLRVEEKGNLTPLKLTKDPVSIFVSTKESKLEVELKFKIVSNIETSLKSIEGSSIDVYKGELKSPSIIATMINKDLITNKENEFKVKYKSFSLASASELIEIKGNKILGLSYGSTTIEAIANDNKECRAKLTVNIIEAPAITDFEIINQVSELTLGKTHKLEYKLLPNKYSEIKEIKYISTNPEYLEIDSSGTIRALKPTLAPIEIKIIINGISKSISINVIPNKEIIDNNGNLVTLDHFTISPNKDNIVQYTNTKIDINTLFSYKAYTTNNKLIDASLEFSFIAHDNAKIDGNYITILKPGATTISIHLDGYEDKLITIYSLDSFNIANNRLTLDVNKEGSIAISPSNNLGYHIINDSEAIKARLDDNNIKILGIYEGNSKIKLVPELPNSNREINKILENKFSIEIEIITNNIIATSIEMYAEVMHYDEKIEEIDINNMNIYLNELVMLMPDANKEATIKHFTFRVKNPTILFVSNTGLIRPKSPGNTIVYIHEGYSNITKEIPISIKHKISLNKDNPVKIDGPNSKYDKESNSFTIQNGLSNMISLSYREDATYKNASFKSSDEKILTVGKDGRITPHRKGTASIIITIDDGINESLELNVNITVTRQDAIQDLQSFFAKVRKGIGHFGAFLILGIFSTLTLMMYFSPKWWVLAIPINFGQGFGLAAFTEYLQTLVKGRYGCIEDVFLDYKGFIISAILITIIFITIYLFKNFKKNKN